MTRTERWMILMMLLVILVCLLTLEWVFAAPPFPVSTSNGMQWNAPTTNTDGTPLVDLLGYNIYQAATCTGPWTGYASVAAPDTTFVDLTPLVGGTCYRVTAINTQGKESGPGITSTGATALGFPVPQGPQMLRKTP